MRSIPTTRSWVRWRDDRPPRYVTETKDGRSGCSSISDSTSRVCSASFFGGKNSNEYVRPAASRSAMVAMTAA